MKPSADVHWKQRFSNFNRALAQLTDSLEKPDLSKLEQQGLIKAFEYTYELAWRVIKDLFEAQGEVGILGSRDAFRLAFRRGLIRDGDQWMRMIESRIQTAHTYDEKAALEVIGAIKKSYHPLFLQLAEALNEPS